MKNRLLAICLTCCAALFYFGFLVPMRQADGRPTDQLLSPPSISSDAACSLPAGSATTFTYYLPIVTHLPRELHGYVTENGVPAEGITVTLFKQFPHPYYYIWLGNTTTDSNGYYNFTGIPSLSCDPNNAPIYCWGYYIDYFGPDLLPGYLDYWETTPITEYVQGTAQQFPTFDISAPVLLFPGAGDVVSPTLTFTWIPRALPTDNYELEIWEPSHSDPDVSISDLGYTNAYTASFVGNNCGGPCANLYDRPLRWRLSLRKSAMQGYGYMKFSGIFTITTP